MQNKIILLVEDNPDDVLLTKRALKKNNILNEIIVVEDGVEALDYLYGTGQFSNRDMSQMPEVILLDLKLPKLDGHEVLRHIRKEASTQLIPVVIFTTSDEEADMVNSYRLGANSYVRKPLDMEEFNQAVKQLGLYWLILNKPVIFK